MGFVGALIRRAETKPRFRRVLDSLLADPDVRSTLLHRIGAQAVHSDVGLDDVMPDDVGSLEHLEDLDWLFSSNYANRGVSQMMFDEASWLMQYIRGLDRPLVAEVGRAKGGTTFLMAVAGARVLSLDDESFERGRDRMNSEPSGFRASIHRALERAGLAERVELVSGDARSYVVPDDRYDLVYIDFPFDAADMDRVFENWWPAVKPDGRLILRDGNEPRVAGPSSLARSIISREDVALSDDAPGRFVVATRVGHDSNLGPATVTHLRPESRQRRRRRSNSPVA